MKNRKGLSKKIALIVAAVVIATIIVGAVAFAGDNAKIGCDVCETWRTTDLGYSETIRFKSDGTSVWQAEDASMSIGIKGTWQQTGNRIVAHYEGMRMEFEIEGNKLYGPKGSPIERPRMWQK